MKERPILFNAAMVNAILSGRKTQTRRVVKDAPDEWEPEQLPATTEEGFQTFGSSGLWGCATDPNEDAAIKCPFGIEGDQLWVRETHIAFEVGRVHYRASQSKPDPKADKEHGVKWTPSIFMPRWASRIQLEITNVRVERLNDISPDNALAEGVSSNLREHDACCDVVDQFQALWDSINAKAHPWASNPWVWVVDFKLLNTGEVSNG